jgi:hypothetical protein
MEQSDWAAFLAAAGIQIAYIYVTRLIAEIYLHRAQLGVPAKRFCFPSKKL